MPEPRISLEAGRLVLSGFPVPRPLYRPERNAPCLCGTGRKFKKCCWQNTFAANPSKLRLLVVGAGASFAEGNVSSANPNTTKPFPLLRNFAATVFGNTVALQAVVASYLTDLSITFAATGPFEETAVGTFIGLERAGTVNVEELFEHVWERHGGTSDLWNVLVREAIFDGLFRIFTGHLGLSETAAGFPTLRLGTRVASHLHAGDRVVNLNYDTVFDIALQQAQKFILYSPAEDSEAVLVYKPHGSLNLYADQASGDFFFASPCKPHGSPDIRGEAGRAWSLSAAIIPPRLGKGYAQKSIAHYVLSRLEGFQPSIVTFWGVGLAPSDGDLLDIYVHACASATRVESVNPDPAIYDRAGSVLKVPITHYKDLDEWESGQP